MSRKFMAVKLGTSETAFGTLLQSAPGYLGYRTIALTDAGPIERVVVSELIFDNVDDARFIGFLAQSKVHEDRIFRHLNDRFRVECEAQDVATAMSVLLGFEHGTLRSARGELVYLNWRVSWRDNPKTMSETDGWVAASCSPSEYICWFGDGALAEKIGAFVRREGPIAVTPAQGGPAVVSEHRDETWFAPGATPADARFNSTMLLFSA